VGHGDAITQQIDGAGHDVTRALRCAVLEEIGGIENDAKSGRGDLVDELPRLAAELTTLASSGSMPRSRRGSPPVLPPFHFDEKIAPGGRAFVAGMKAPLIFAIAGCRCKA